MDLYQIPLNDILKYINMSDLNRLIQSEKYRRLIRSATNYQDLEINIILNCIDDFEKTSQLNLFYKLLGEYFEPKGFDFRYLKQNEIYQAAMEEFYDKLLEYPDFDDEIVAEIENKRDDNVEFSEVKDFLSYWIENYPEELQDLFVTTDKNIDNLTNKLIKDFKNYLFNPKISPNAYQNIYEYLEVLNGYLDDYYNNNDEELIIKNNFYQCLSQIGKVKNLFQSVIRQREGISRIPNKKQISRIER
jgi:hypothetical protein